MNKLYQAGDLEVLHKNPVWRNKANFIIVAYLGNKDGHNEWEQLWALQLGEKHFSICCIPFFSYNIALGDEVETDKNYIIQRVLRKSGQYTFRVWFGNTNYAGIIDEVLLKFENLSVELEWSSDNLLAISVSSDKVQDVAEYLYTRHSAGDLIYEMG